MESIQDSTGWTQSAWTREGKRTSCASAPWLPWPPSASGQGSSRTQPQPTCSLSPPPLKSEPVPLPLEHHRGDKTLDLGRRKLLLLAILKGKGPLDNVLADVIFLGQVKQLPDLAGALGTQPARDRVVGQSRDLSLSLLDDGHGEDGEVAVDDASADGLPLALSILARAVASGSLLQQQPHPAVGQDTLLHGEALLVVASSDSENVSLELITKGIGLDLLAHPLLIEGTHLQLIGNLDELLASRGRVRQA